MRHPLLLLAFLPFGLFAQTLDYRWLNQPCAQVLSCDSGCTACNLPESGGAVLMGTNLAALGIDVCPHPVSVADNALFTYGWPTIADDAHELLISGLVFQPLQIDSIIVRHRAGTDGPERIRLGLSINNAPAVTIADEVVDGAFCSSSLTDLGIVAPGEGMASGLFQLVLQPYQGQGGSWDVDEVRVVTSPAALTGITELQAPRYTNAPRYDLWGRPAPRSDVDGVYFDRFKRIRVQ